MQPTMILQAACARLGGQRQRLGQPAGLVELDVDGVVAPGECLEAGAVVHRLVGAHGHRARTGERRIGAGRQRLLDQLDAGLGRSRHQRRQQLGRPGLVGIGDQARSGAGGANLAQARLVAGAAELELQERHGACGDGGLGGHGLGGVEADRYRPWRRAAAPPVPPEPPRICRSASPRSPTARSPAHCARRRPASAAAGSPDRTACRAGRGWHRAHPPPSRRSASRARTRRARPTLPSLTCATTTVASRLAPRAMTNAPAIGQLSTTASMASCGIGLVPLPFSSEWGECRVRAGARSGACGAPRPDPLPQAEREGPRRQRKRPLAWARKR